MHEFDDYHKIRLNIGGRMYSLWVADTDKKRNKGLSTIDHLPDNQGMIFLYDKPTRNKFSMRNTAIPLTIVFLDEKGKTVHQEKCKPFQEKLVKSSKPYKYVIEI